MLNHASRLQSAKEWETGVSGVGGRVRRCNVTNEHVSLKTKSCF